MAIEEEPEPGIPEWVVTFGDMMSLLLTFFIMLVSMSEIKEEERFQAMLESMRRAIRARVVHQRRIVPGEIDPAEQQPVKPSQAWAGPSGIDIMRRRQPRQVRQGRERPACRQSARGKNATNRRRGSSTKTPPSSPPRRTWSKLQRDRQPDRRQAAEGRGPRPHVAEASIHAATTGQLSYRTMHTEVMKFLIEEADPRNRIDPNRIRLGAAAANMSQSIEGDQASNTVKRNARVEILVWDEADRKRSDPRPASHTGSRSRSAQPRPRLSNQ